MQQKDIFEQLTGRPTTGRPPGWTQEQAKLAEKQPTSNKPDIFEKLTGRKTESALDKKIEVPDKVKQAKDAHTIASAVMEK